MAVAAGGNRRLTALVVALKSHWGRTVSGEGGDRKRIAQRIGEVLYTSS
jgi:hypothetical protein